jgi:hypothetical protein
LFPRCVSRSQHTQKYQEPIKQTRKSWHFRCFSCPGRKQVSLSGLATNSGCGFSTLKFMLNPGGYQSEGYLAEAATHPHLVITAIDMASITSGCRARCFRQARSRQCLKWDSLSQRRALGILRLNGVVHELSLHYCITLWHYT